MFFVAILAKENGDVLFFHVYLTSGVRKPGGPRLPVLIPLALFASYSFLISCLCLAKASNVGLISSSVGHLIPTGDSKRSFLMC